MQRRVTILTPTQDRPAFLARCAKYVGRQTYPKELLQWVIVDGGSGPFEVPQVDGVLISVVHRRGVTGELRNAGCRVAMGELIIHFDDDDWQAPDRIEKQVAAFTAAHIELVCSDNFYCLLLDENPPRAQRSVSWELEMYMQGCTFAYRRSTWQKSPFAPIPVGEDHLFARTVRFRNRAGAVNQRDASYLVYVRHGGNTCPFDEVMRTAASANQLEWVRAIMGENDYQATRALVGFGGDERPNELCHSE